MTGRDLIDYIVSNGLEDAEYFTEKSILGMISEEEAAAKFKVGESTIRVWVNKELVKGFNMNGRVFIPADSKDPRLVERDVNLEVLNEK